MEYWHSYSYLSSIAFSAARLELGSVLVTFPSIALSKIDTHSREKRGNMNTSRRCLFLTIFICLCQEISCFKAYQKSIFSAATKCRAIIDNVAVEADVVSSGQESFKAPAYEIDRRRNFAIISHPDAGKTTLTEKLLLFGGAIQDAGAVKARGDQRKVTSDWMEIEKAR